MYTDDVPDNVCVECIEKLTANPRAELLDFIQLMEIVLKQNDHKGGWGDYSEKVLFNQLVNEVFELHTEFIVGNFKNSYNDLNLIKECIDVANFAMMIVNKRVRFLTKYKNMSLETIGKNLR